MMISKCVNFSSESQSFKGFSTKYSSFRAIRSQQTQRESLQRDYIFLLQTSLSNEDGRLFGGTKVK